MTGSVVTFSNRLPPDTAPNALTHAVEAMRAAGSAFGDLTESNPTTAGFDYPADLLAPLADARALRYEPHPLGLRTAREAVAGEFARRGAAVDPAHIVLSASSSETYSWLFKLLCSPGDGVLVPRPSYPLFEHLTRLEGVRTTSYELEYHGRWQTDFDAIESAPSNTRALLIVSPNNPTGTYVSRADLDRLLQYCSSRNWALIADEVFVDYPLETTAPVTDVATHAGVLAFTLGGASKSLGLPQVKLGWTLVGGPPARRDAALAALELIADSYLSVSTPVQVAAPVLLERGAAVRGRIQERIRRNLARARTVVAAHPSCEVLPVEGGWTAVVRLPATRDEETVALELLQRHRVLVHPGYYYDLPKGTYVVVSLLPREEVFAAGFERLVAAADS